MFRKVKPWFGFSLFAQASAYSFKDKLAPGCGYWIIVVSLHLLTCNILYFFFYLIISTLPTIPPPPVNLTFGHFLLSSPLHFFYIPPTSLPPPLSLLIDRWRSQSKSYSMTSVTQYQAHPAGLSHTHTHSVIQSPTCNLWAKVTVLQ